MTAREEKIKALERERTRIQQEIDALENGALEEAIPKLKELPLFHNFMWQFRSPVTDLGLRQFPSFTIEPVPHQKDLAKAQDEAWALMNAGFNTRFHISTYAELALTEDGVFIGFSDLSDNSVGAIATLIANFASFVKEYRIRLCTDKQDENVSYAQSRLDEEIRLLNSTGAFIEEYKLGEIDADD